MENQHALRLFALARGLVPDPDVAADLFLQSRSEADLLERAARWRRQQGLPDLPAPGALPPLDPAEQELALHLARRGRKRRLTLRALIGLGAALLLITGILGYRALPSALGRGLASDPAFAGSPAVHADTPTGLSFAVYRAEAVPGRTTLWWELTGPGAARAAEVWVAGMRLGLDRTAPLHTQTAADHKNRVVGRSDFPLLLPGELTVLLIESPEGPPLAVLGVSLRHLPDDPAAKSYPVRQDVHTVENRVFVDRLLLSPTATKVVLIGLPWLPEVLADEVLLEPVGIWPQALRRPNEYQVILPPVPSGTRRLELRFPPGEPWVWQPQVITLPAPDLFASWQRDDDGLRATLTLEAYLHGTGHFVDAAGETFLAVISPDPLGQNRWRLEAELTDERLVREGSETRTVVREAGELVQLHLAVPMRLETPTLSIDLP